MCVCVCAWVYFQNGAGPVGTGLQQINLKLSGGSLCWCEHLHTSSPFYHSQSELLRCLPEKSQTLIILTQELDFQSIVFRELEHFLQELAHIVECILVVVWDLTQYLQQKMASFFVMETGSHFLSHNRCIPAHTQTCTYTNLPIHKLTYSSTCAYTNLHTQKLVHT